MENAQNCLLPMGVTSENVAQRFGVSRENQDQAAVSRMDLLSRSRLLVVYVGLNSWENVFRLSLTGRLLLLLLVENLRTKLFLLILRYIVRFDTVAVFMMH